MLEVWLARLTGNKHGISEALPVADTGPRVADYFAIFHLFCVFLMVLDVSNQSGFAL